MMFARGRTIICHILYVGSNIKAGDDSVIGGAPKESPIHFVPLVDARRKTEDAVAAKLREILC